MKKRILSVLVIMAIMVSACTTASNGENISVPTAKPVESTQGSSLPSVTPEFSATPTTAPDTGNEVQMSTGNKTVKPSSDSGTLENFYVFTGDLAGVGDRDYISCYSSPPTAFSSYTYTSLTDIVSVREDGLLTALKPGEGEIKVESGNGIIKYCTVRVPESKANLTFELTEDKTGYRITGCDVTEASSVYIPAEYNGLPVKEIADKAFTDCENIIYFWTDEKQEYFYSEDGVLYTDRPVKTLVRFPNAHSSIRTMSSSYKPSDGTIAIAPYAFSGSARLNYLHLPEGLKTIGDGAFAEIKWELSVHVPNSLTEIGEYILKNQHDNAAFYGSEECAMRKYANKYNIPFGIARDRETYNTDVSIVVPAYDKNEDYTANGAVSFYYDDFRGTSVYEVNYIEEYIDISDYQNKNIAEVRIPLTQAFNDLIPDATGKHASHFPELQGLYGLGYTEEPALLIAYDSSDKVIGTINIDGNFIFAFPKAYNLGVAGGKGTSFTVFPYEPVFITSPGYYALDSSKMIEKDDGSFMQRYVIAMPYGSFSLHFSNYMNCFSYSFSDSKKNYLDRDTTEYYSVINGTFSDKYFIDKMSNTSLEIDALKVLYEDDECLCLAKSSYNLTDEYGKWVAGTLSELKAIMIGTYYPSDLHVNRIKVMANGNYPTSYESTIHLDDYCLDMDSSTKFTLYHEMVHAIDQSLPGYKVIPSAWLEGRAEYIGYKATAVNNIDYYGYYSETYDWSFLSPEEKNDFFSYYCYSTNRYTTYPVGYYFYKYILETYGEIAALNIVSNIGAIKEEDIPDWSTENWEAKRYAMFKKCVTDATCETVFDDFANKYIK